MKTSITKAELATVLGLSERRVHQLADDGVIPAGKGRLDLPRAVQAYIRFIKAGRDLLTLQEAKIRKLNTERELKELELARRRGELVESQEVLDVIGRGLTAMRQAILAASNLEDEDRDQIINRIREAGQSVVNLVDAAPKDEGNAQRPEAAV